MRNETEREKERTEKRERERNVYSNPLISDEATKRECVMFPNSTRIF